MQPSHYKERANIRKAQHEQVCTAHCYSTYSRRLFELFELSNGLSDTTRTQVIRLAAAKLPSQEASNSGGSMLQIGRMAFWMLEDNRSWNSESWNNGNWDNRR